MLSESACPRRSFARYSWAPGGDVYTAVRSVNTLGPGQPSPSRISFNHYVFALWPQMLSDGSLNISQVTLLVLTLLRVDDVKKKSAVNT